MRSQQLHKWASLPNPHRPFGRRLTAAIFMAARARRHLTPLAYWKTRYALALNFLVRNSFACITVSTWL